MISLSIELLYLKAHFLRHIGECALKSFKAFCGQNLPAVFHHADQM
ncbi:hypothetical protein GFS31_11270 [Leptolyngbya sp. BL0902]|nr:hypothetical protein GFS31_11270 [Leptolyngbya sp. BL0902]